MDIFKILKKQPTDFTEYLRKNNIGIVEPTADEKTIRELEKLLEEKRKELEEK